MLDVVKMKEVCRICARELCGNQRRWIFHPAAKLNLQVLLSHALGRELTRDGRGEFVCSKCAFMLDRMYRFDTVIARVEALSLERLHKLLLEKDRLRQCIGGLYRKNNMEEGGVAPAGSGLGVVGTEAGTEDSPVVDLSALQDGRYSVMIQDDLTYSVYESWADREDSGHDHHHHHHHCSAGDVLSGQKPRRCRGCAALRVADSDYEAVCKVPRKVGRRSTSCGPSTRYSPGGRGVEDPARASGGSEATTIALELDTDKTTCDPTSPSPASSVESLDTAVDMSCPPSNHKEREEADPEEAPARRDTVWDKPPSDTSLSTLDTMLNLLRGWDYRPVKTRPGSKLPVLVKDKLQQNLLLPPSISLRSPCGGTVDSELYHHLHQHHQQTIPEVVTSSPQQDLQVELAEMEEQWLDDYVQCGPFRFQQERLVDEQQQQLSRYEDAAGQCVGELQKAQDQVQSLQSKIRESDTRNQKLQQRLSEMEMELRSAREEAQRQERNIQNISDNVVSKEAEAAELYHVIEEQNKMLCSLKQLSNHNQLQQLQASGADSVRGQTEVLALQASLFQAQLELQAAQRSQRQAARTQDDLNRALQRLENDLQGALQHRRDTERHNQELQSVLDQTRSALQEREEQMREDERQRQREKEERERSIRELKTTLQSKERLLEDYCELLDDPKERKDSLLQKLRQRITERDRALERAVDEKFRCIEEKDEETRRLQLLLREKQRDVERQSCVLVNNEETIASLELLLRGKSLQLEQMCDSWSSVQRQQQESDERQRRVLRERDAIIVQLQGALQTRTQETQELRSSLLAQIHSAPADVLEELKLRLQLKDHLFQEVLADRTRQSQEHQDQVQSLITAIGSRDQYIQDSTRRLDQVMTEQTSRLQELRRQLSSGVGSKVDSGPDSAVAELQAAQDELRLALRREKENQELNTSQAAQLDSLSRKLRVKDEVIRDFQRQLVDPSDLPLVERLMQEVQDLRESLVQRGAPPARGPVPGRDRANGRQPEFGELSSEFDDEADEDLISDDTESVDEDESRLRVQPPAAAKGAAPSHDLLFEGHGLMEVKQLVEQKRAVERELGELKAQLEKTGFSSLSQMRKALFSLQDENEDLKRQLTEGPQPHSNQRSDDQTALEGEEEDEEEELDVTIEGVEEELEEEESSEMWETWDNELSLSHTDSDEQRKTRVKPESLQLLATSCQVDEPPASRQQEATSSSTKSEKTVRLQLKSKELKERLMVSEATVQAQAEQLKDYRELLTETTVQQDSKQIQVDLQDLGYETCGRSENEAEREETSSPEFDDLEMCTSLDCGSQWWPTNGSSTFTKTDEVSSLQRLVEDLRSQLSRSQGVIRGLQSRLRSFSTSSDYGASSSAPRKVNWGFQASPSQSGTEDDEGWQSSDGGLLTSPHHPPADKGLQELVSRVDALENQLRKGGKKSAEQDGKSGTWPGKFDTLIQTQARELSHLRQRLREGRGVCNILTQHLGDTTKAFEELLRANDIDYYMGQSFREQLAQSSALAQRVCAKISGRDHPEDPDEKTELLAIRLSKELQQKDKLIESLRAKLNQHHHHPHHPHRSDTPCSSRALSDATDQSDRISYVSDEHGSVNEDLELCSDVDAASELGQEETRASTVGADCHSHSGSMSRHPSVPPSVASSLRSQSCLSCPSMQCSGSPQHKPADVQSQTAPASVSAPLPPPSSSNQAAPFSSLPLPTTPLRTRYPGGAGFSLAEVHQELQMLQRQLGDSQRFSTPQSKPLQGFPFVHQQSDSFPPLSFHGYQPSPFGSAASSIGLDASLAMKTGVSLLESSALWDATYGIRPVRLGADLSSGSSGYQSGASHTGSDLMKEHLREVRSLRQRLEDSIQTNDRLRQQLEDRLARTASEKGAPTNIYIQGLDSVTQLTAEIRLLKDENISLQNQLKQATREGSKEADQLREAGLLDRARLKEAELEADRWAEQSRKLQTEAEAHNLEITQLKQERQRSQESINRLQHEVSVLQQQLCESRSLVHALQCELQVYHRVGGASTSSGQVGDGVQSGHGAVTFDPRELHLQLEQQLSGQPRARRQLFNDNVPSPPVRDTGLVSSSSPLRSVQKPSEQTGASGHGLTSQAVDASFSSRRGRHAVGHIEDFQALQQQILEGGALLSELEVTLRSLIVPALQEFSLRQPSDSAAMRKLLSDTTTLRQILEEADSLLRMFWRAALPNAEDDKQDQSLKDEVALLRLRLSEREQALKDAMEVVKSSNRTKDSMEHFIISQLSRTRDVLKKAKTNLQVKSQEAVTSPSVLVGAS